MRNNLKFFLVLLLIPMLAMSSVQLADAEHNEEFPENGCDTADHTINVSAEGDELHFIIDGEINPDLQVDAGSCVKVVFDNPSNLDHDFTVVDDVTDSDNPEELIHMDTPAGNTTEHLWQMPDRDVELNYFCEVPGHRASGMEGVFVIGEPSGALPGFNFIPAFLALFAIVAVPTLRKKL